MLTPEEIIIELERFCPWWTTGKLDLPDDTVKRDTYQETYDELMRKKVLVIRGMRQVGKTTLINQMIYSLLKSYPKERILYCSFDLLRGEKKSVRQVIETYLESILREPLSDLTDDTYLFLDEVQKVPDWGDVIKHYHDIQKRLYIVASGSSSVTLTKGAGDALVGRTALLDLDPFSFKEYLRYIGLNLTGEIIFPGKLRLPRNSEKIRIEFERFKTIGGLPGLFTIEDELTRLKEVRTYIDLTITRDILEVYKVRSPRQLKALFNQIVSTSGQRVNYNNLSNALKVKYDTIQNYIEYLDSAHLIQIVPHLSGGPVKTHSKNPKLYCADHSFFILEHCKDGLIAETMAANHAGRLARNAGGETLFWVDDQGREVDIVISIKKTLLPIEVKYSDVVSPRDLRGLNQFCKKFDCKQGFVVTRSKHEWISLDDVEVQAIPLWLFLLSNKLNISGNQN